MAKPNVAYVEKARSVPLLDPGKLSNRLGLPETPRFDHLVAYAQAALEDYHFWAGLGRHGRDLQHFIGELRSQLDTVQAEYRRHAAIDVFAPMLDDSPLDGHLTNALRACDGILAEFKVDGLPDWLVNDPEAATLNLDVGAKDQARRALAVKLAVAFQRFARLDHRNWTDERYRGALYDFVGAIFEAYTIRKGKNSVRMLLWPSDRSGRERLIPPVLRVPARK